MGDEFQWRLLRQRVEQGLATGVLCRQERARGWIERLLSIPLSRLAGDATVYFVTGATVTVCTSPEQALSSRGGRGPTMWIDEDDLLEASLPAPAPERDE